MSELETSIVINGFHLGFATETKTSFGTVSSDDNVKGLTGFVVSKEKGSTVPTQVVSLTGNDFTEDSPSVQISALYVQNGTLKELDLDLRWVDLPGGTKIAVESTNPKLTINPRKADGSGNSGVFDKNASEGETSFVIRVWLTDPRAITASSTISMALSSIETPGSGAAPVKKTLLEKIELNLG